MLDERYYGIYGDTGYEIHAFSKLDLAEKCLKDLKKKFPELYFEIRKVETHHTVMGKNNDT